jgi:hypothetical protein
MTRYTLPVFEDLTRAFGRAFSHQVAEATRSDGLLAKISGHTIHEGRTSTFVTDEGHTNPRSSAHSSRPVTQSCTIRHTLRSNLEKM